MTEDLNQEIEVLEVDQWTSTGNIRSLPWEALKAQGISAIVGGDSHAARVIFGGSFRFRSVRLSARPSIGSVWFACDDKGFPVLYLANYDSSD